MDFRNVAEEIVAHLRGHGSELVLKIEIEANNPAGFDDREIRTVSENAQVLRFDQSGRSPQ